MNQSLEGSDIVVTGLQPWDFEIGSNCKDIALELARTNRVLYVNRALDRISLWRSPNTSMVTNRKDVINGTRDPILEVSENLWVLNPRVMLESINILPGGWPFDVLNKRNNRLMAREIEFGIEKLDFKDVVLFNDNEFVRSFYLQEMIPHHFSIYYLRDYLELQPYFRKHSKLEKLLMRKSDYVMTNSQFLAEYAAKYNPKSFFVGQGFDQSLFSEIHSEIPNDLDEVKKPVVGYLGSLTSQRLDIALMVEMAKKLTDCSVVLVGPEDEVFERSELHKLPNVHFLGSKPTEQVPEYINGFDVCINPQIVNPLTIGNYPRKIDEYLILGKPVVATKTQAMTYFRDFTYLATTAETFAEQIVRALEENSPDRQLSRKKFAQSHTWRNSVELMKNIVANNDEEVIYEEAP